MKYLSGHYNESLPPEVGIMTTPRSGANIPEGRIWAVDTGCFASPQDYADEVYLRFLSNRSYARDRCLFATAPDVVQDAKATMEVAMPMLPRIRDAGYRASLVAQDGIESMSIPWSQIDYLFIGGSTEWKYSDGLRWLVGESRKRGIPVHMGRVNSYKRLAYSAAIGCSTADGTFLAFGPNKNIPRLQGWLRKLENPQQLLLEGAA